MKTHSWIELIAFLLILFGLPFLTTGCGQSYEVVARNPLDDSGIIKKRDMIKGAVGEIAPILLKGQPYLISFNDTSTGNGFIQVQSYPDLSIISRTPFAYNYGSAIVENDTVHIFASSGEDHANHIVTATSTDLLSWSAPTTVFTVGANQKVYNSSVAKTDTGFVMTIEIHEEGYQVWWQNQFLASTDLITWSSFGGVYAPVDASLNGAACPTIRYSNGWYYIVSLRARPSIENHSQYYTIILRSRDLVTFEESSKLVLTSAGRTDEGTNNSDFDFFELNGRMIIVYLVGDQVTFGFMKQGFYEGTFEQFVKEFF